MTKSVTKVQDRDTTRRLSVVRSTEDPTKYGVVILNPDGSKISGPKGEKGDKGDKGDAGTISVGETTTGLPGTDASVENVGTNTDAILKFTIPRGDKGIKGDKGDKGDAATISVGTTTTLSPGNNASVVNSGTTGDAVLNFSIPRGDKGETGDTGNGIVNTTKTKVGKVTTVEFTYANGTTFDFNVSDGSDGEGSGDVIGPNSSTDGDVVLFDGNSGKIIKDSGKKLPNVVDNLNSTSSTDALSANQGKVLNDKINSALALGRFLSLWNSATGLPISFPRATPYTYNTGDWFMVEVVSTANPPVNYKPDGSVYNNIASSVQDTVNNVQQGDVYIYDGQTWLFQKNNEVEISFANITGDPMDNTLLANAFNGKQDKLIAGNNITIGSDGKTINAVDTTYNNATQSVAGLMSASDKTKLDGIEAQAQKNTITGVKGSAESTYRIGQVNISPANLGLESKNADSGGQDVSLVTTGEKYQWNNALQPNDNISELNNDAGYLTTAPVTSVNGQTGAVTVEEGKTKLFTLSSTSDLTTAQAVLDWVLEGKEAVIEYSYFIYHLAVHNTTNNALAFSGARGMGAASSGTWQTVRTLSFSVSGTTVTGVSYQQNNINISSSAPSSGTGNGTITLVI